MYKGDVVALNFLLRSIKMTEEEKMNEVEKKEMEEFIKNEIIPELNKILVKVKERYPNIYDSHEKERQNKYSDDPIFKFLIK
jgi:hypothetical protein